MAAMPCFLLIFILPLTFASQSPIHEHFAAEPTHDCIHEAIARRQGPLPHSRQLYDEAGHDAALQARRLNLLARRAEADTIHTALESGTPLEEAVQLAHAAGKRRANSDYNVTAGFAPLRLHLNFSYVEQDEANRTCYQVGDWVWIKKLDPYPGPKQPAHDECADDEDVDCWLECTALRTLSASKHDYLVNDLIPNGVSSLQEALSVVPVIGNLVLSSGRCSDAIEIPDAYTGSGWPNIDMALFVTARPTQGSTIAFASTCQTDQNSRPIAGHLNFGPNKIPAVNDATSYQMALGVVMHEITHALGFSSTQFTNYRADSTPYDQVTHVDHSMSTLNSSITIDAASPLTQTVSVIQTPNVVAAVRAHFGCSTLHGAEIEGGGGSGTAGSHWEKRIFNEEYMTGSSSSSPVFSDLTLALFDDMGWYVTDRTKAGVLDWGKGKGCAFATGSCFDWSGTGYHCTTVGDTGCTYNRLAKGYCSVVTHSVALDPKYQYFSTSTKGGVSALSDYCPFTRPYTNGDCRYTANKGPDADVFSESYASDSRCFHSSLLDSQYVSTGDFRSSCHRSACISSTELKVMIDSIYFDCPQNGGALKHDGFHGKLNCPSASTICAGKPTDLSWPRFEKVVPSKGSSKGGDTITVFGTGFLPGDHVWIGDLECGSSYALETNITCITPEQELLITDPDTPMLIIVERPGSSPHRMAGPPETFLVENDSLGFLQDVVDFFLEQWKAVKPYAVKYWWASFILIIPALIIWRRHQQAKRLREEEEAALVEVPVVRRAGKGGRGRGSVRGRSSMRGRAPGGAVRRGGSTRMSRVAPV